MSVHPRLGHVACVVLTIHAAWRFPMRQWRRVSLQCTDKSNFTLFFFVQMVDVGLNRHHVKSFPTLALFRGMDLKGGSVMIWGWSGGAKVLCILHHRGVQLILAYSWARPAILVVGKGRGGMFLFLLFLHFHSCSSFFPVPLFHLLYSLFYLFSPFLWETTQNDPQGLTCR